MIIKLLVRGRTRDVALAADLLDRDTCTYVGPQRHIPALDMCSSSQVCSVTLIRKVNGQKAYLRSTVLLWRV